MAASEAKPLYSTCVAVLGFICFVVGATAVGIPMWGYFGTPGWGSHILHADKLYRRECKNLAQIV
ncbi:hypothetical protein HUJ04_009748 [Dendroctonus ponderosae]|nr:hypothetical protein HUJ04_009748 [Dendroctonus ponderosae]